MNNILAQLLPFCAVLISFTTWGQCTAELLLDKRVVTLLVAERDGLRCGKLWNGCDSAQLVATDERIISLACGRFDHTKLRSTEITRVISYTNGTATEYPMDNRSKNQLKALGNCVPATMLSAPPIEPSSSLPRVGAALRKAGTYRNVGLFAAVLGTAVGGVILSTAEGNETQEVPGIIVMGAGAVIGLSFSIAGNIQEISAGDVLLGR